jgi:hypothetical protein
MENVQLHVPVYLMAGKESQIFSFPHHALSQCFYISPVTIIDSRLSLAKYDFGCQLFVSEMSTAHARTSERLPHNLAEEQLRHLPPIKQEKGKII